MSKNDIWLMDMSRFEPVEAISRELEDGKWVAVDYEIDRGGGTMLFSKPAGGAPPVTLKLDADGWYAIRLGLYYGADNACVKERLLHAKLTGDDDYSRFRAETTWAAKDGHYPEKTFTALDICEVFWKCADLSGQDLVIRRPLKGPRAHLGADELYQGVGMADYRCESNLAYVRLTAMDEADMAEWRSEQPTPETRRLIANFDGGNTPLWETNDGQDFQDGFACLRDSDFGIALHAMARGSNTIYPSKVGQFIRPTGFYGHGYCLRALVERGVDPLAEAIKAAHQCGVQLFPQVRFTGVNMPLWHGKRDNGGKLMADHPEWMAVYPDGKPTRHLSFAYEGVREFYVRLMREWVEDYRADGVNALFSRGYPFVYYEEPVCRAFHEAYGEDMCELPPGDPRVMQIRAGFVTQFLREVRAMLDEVGRAQGRHIPTSYLVPVGNSPPNIPAGGIESFIHEFMFNALDVETWIAEGLVDYLVIHAHRFGEHDGSELKPGIRQIADLARGTKTKVYVDIYPRRIPPRVYRKIAMSYYDAGADGLATWDSHSRRYRASEQAFFNRLGHRDDLARWDAAGKGDDYFRVVPLVTLDGFGMDREFTRPNDG